MNLLISYSLRLTQGDAALVIPNLPYSYIIHVALIAIPCASLIASFQPPLIMFVVICWLSGVAPNIATSYSLITSINFPGCLAVHLCNQVLTCLVGLPFFFVV